MHREAANNYINRTL